MVLDDTYLNEMRRLGDYEADQLVQQLFRQKKEKQIYSVLTASRAAVEAQPPNSIRNFLINDPIIPDWFDQSRLERGQLFFKKYALEIMTLLGALALPYCYAASPGNKAIYFTGKMKKSPGKRLVETAHFIISVLSEGSFGKNGNAAFEIQRTRLVHALVRHFVSSTPEWDMLKWGLPVNQEDMAGTNLAFSYIVLTGLEKLNFKMETREKEDFLFAWKFIGYLLRIDEKLLPNCSHEARLLEDKIKIRHFKFSEEAKVLTDELLEHYRESFPVPAGYFVESQMRYFVGPEVSSLLGLKEHPIKDRIVSGINEFQRKINNRFTNPFSFQIMIRNHNQLRRKYQ